MSESDDGPTIDPEAYLAGLLKNAGFGDTEQSLAMRNRLLQDVERDANMAREVRALFSTVKGRKVLDWLYASTIAKGEVPVSHLLTTPPAQWAAFAAFRAGENSVVEMIFLAIGQASKRKRKKRDPTA